MLIGLKLFCTMKKIALPDAANLSARDQVGRYGSFSLVTGLIRNVFTDVSNSTNNKIYLIFQ